MTLEELLEKRSKLLDEVEGATEERFKEIKLEIEKLNLKIAAAQADKQKEDDDANKRAARSANGTNGGANTVVLFDSNKGNNLDPQKQNEDLEKRATSLKNGKKAKFETRAVASTSAAFGTAVSDTINPNFSQVGTLDQLVNAVHLEGTGAESYKKPFAKNIGVGEIVEEGKAPTNNAEPEFDYATINKVKIVAYAEVNEEIEKLPAANYMAEVDKAVVKAWRRKLNRQIMNGVGENELVGITNAPAKIINTAQKKTIASINENTLDDIVFDYGGDEEIEDEAVLLLHKLTLKEFARVKGTDKRRAYDIVVRGNTGTINGIPFVTTSTLVPFSKSTESKPYIVYGKPQGYELAHFSDLEVEKSTDYKFKEGVICLKVSGFVGGSPASYNGFLSVYKGATTPSVNE